MKWSLRSFDQLTLDQLYAILALRTDVFVVEQTCPYPEIDGKDQSSYHLFAEEAGEIIAYLRILPAGLSYEEASIGRVVIRASHRGRGLSRTMMQEAIDYIVRELQECQIKIGAQAHLENFYQSLGFEPVSEVYLEDGIPHVDMLYVKPA
ncbi:TPA: GNAT family N-acetyltransferase [Streptococcus suis]|nr:GNAT family N-acetyltransferase [Streptococcus suis]